MKAKVAFFLSANPLHLQLFALWYQLRKTKIFNYFKIKGNTPQHPAICESAVARKQRNS